MTHWEDLNSGNGEEKDFATPVWEIVVNHGTAPKDRTYAYYVESRRRYKACQGNRLP